MNHPVGASAKRILFVSHSGELGGAERSMLELIEALDRTRFQVFVLCPAPGRLAEQLQSLSFEVFPANIGGLKRRQLFGGCVFLLPNYVWHTRQTIRLLRRLKIDLVHTNSTIAKIWCAAAIWWTRTPSVWHWRDFYDYPRLNRALARTTSVSVGISRSVVRFAKNQLGSTATVALVMNGLVDRPAFVYSTEEQMARRSELNLDRDCVVCAAVGQLTPRKGVDLLVTALASAVKTAPQLRLVLAYPRNSPHEVDAESQLRKRVEQLGCADQVRFAGFTENIPALLRASDMVVVPSTREPFGRIAVEGMLAERPVVASDVDGLSEIVVDGETGLLFPVGNAEKLTSCIIHLAQNPEERRQMGLSGRTRALEHFNVERTAAEIARLYDSVIPKEKRPRSLTQK